MIGGGRFLDRAEMRRAMGAGRLASTEDREDGQPAFLQPGGDEAVAADEEDSEEGEPEQAGPNTVRQEADREQEDHRQPAECGGQDEEEGAFERGPKPVQRHARLEADESEERADGEEAEQPVRNDGKLAPGARQIAGLVRVAGDGGLQDAELPVRNRGMIRTGRLGDRRCGGRRIVGATIGILSGTHGSLMRGQNGGVGCLHVGVDALGDGLAERIRHCGAAVIDRVPIDDEDPGIIEDAGHGPEAVTEARRHGQVEGLELLAHPGSVVANGF